MIVGGYLWYHWDRQSRDYAMQVAPRQTGAYEYVHRHNDQDPARKLEINCADNLRQIGLAVLTWEGDHNGQFPWNVSTNAGGLKEFTGADKDGFVTNAWLVFQVMAEELRSPKVLVCPDDKVKTPAADFAYLTSSNVT